LFRRTVSVFCVIACVTVSALTQSTEQKPIEKASPLEERLGPDDGAALAILFGANFRGNLATCD
jgi:hypothetical protein